MRRDEILPYLYVYKIIFPNGKIYVGADWGRQAELSLISYFGSFKASRKQIRQDHLEHLKAYKNFTITKEILYEAYDQTPEHIWQKEREFIKQLNSRDPNIGYNKR